MKKIGKIKTNFVLSWFIIFPPLGSERCFVYTLVEWHFNNLKKKIVFGTHKILYKPRGLKFIFMYFSSSFFCCPIFFFKFWVSCDVGEMSVCEVHVFEGITVCIQFSLDEWDLENPKNLALWFLLFCSRVGMGNYCISEGGRENVNLSRMRILISFSLALARLLNLSYSRSVQFWRVFDKN